VLGTPDPPGLAEFYRQLLGWVYRDEDHASDDTWVVIKPPGGGTGLSFQLETEHEPPAWPTKRGTQQMQLHLDIGVEDLAAEVARAEGLGARQADWQPQEDVRVLHDPAGHLFCLFAPGG
jgi:catechol 2,3-dioxygenase-like lactoylglutathione lyase family enzyme